MSQYYPPPPVKPQQKSRNSWLVCGVIAAIIICGGSVILFGGLGALAYIGGEPTKEAVVTSVPATQPVVQPAAKKTPTKAPPITKANQIPYESVVQITALVDLNGKIQPGWTGSGTILTPDGLILTNAHVVLSDESYTVEKLAVSITTAQDQPPEARYLAKVVQADASLDIAVIKIISDLKGNPVSGELNLPTVQLGDSDNLTLGDTLTIIGYPGIGGETITLTRGEVSGFTADRGYGNRSFIKTSAAIAGGNSGGLATNDKGQLIGIPTQVGYGGEGQVVDCRALADTNSDGEIDGRDSCIPTGGFINALRPIKLAMPFIQAAENGEENIVGGAAAQEQTGPTGKVLFEDDFSNPDSGWDNDTWEKTSALYNDGEYWLSVTPEKYYTWGNPYQSFKNTEITVDVRVEAPTGTGDFGLICRYQDKDNFYALEVTEDGYYSIWKNEDGEATNLQDWTFFDPVRQGQTVQLTASCIGNNLSLAINNNILAEVTDSTFSSGDVGVIAGTYEIGGFTAAFDNFVVYQP